MSLPGAHQQAFVEHTSASLIVCENGDPQVRHDLEAWLARAVPVAEGRLALGTWQGLYLYEHRTAAHRRRLRVTVLGA